MTHLLFDLVTIAATSLLLALGDHKGMPDGLVWHGGFLTLGERKVAA